MNENFSKGARKKSKDRFHLKEREGEKREE